MKNITAATVSAYYPIPAPFEFVVLTLTDGETYSSRKFNKLAGAIPFWLENTDGDINATVSGATATVNAVGASSSTIGILLIAKR